MLLQQHRVVRSGLCLAPTRRRPAVPGVDRFAARGTAEVPQLEVLYGQQRIISLGLFVAGMLTIVRHGTEQTFSSLPDGDPS